MMRSVLSESECWCVKYLENEWLTKEYMPFYHGNKHVISDNSIAYLNPLLLRVLLEDDSKSKSQVDMERLSSNSALTCNILQHHCDLGWEWISVSSNPGIMMQDIMNNPECPWKWNYVSDNPNLTMSMVIQYPNKEWDWTGISMCPGITMQDIMNHPEYPWEWVYVSSNPNLTMSMILQYPYKPWNWNCISSNPGITMQDIMNHPEYLWEWDYVFRNEFILDKSSYVNNQLGRILLITIWNEYNYGSNNNTRTPISLPLSLSIVELVFNNDYHISNILPYI